MLQKQEPQFAQKDTTNFQDTNEKASLNNETSLSFIEKEETIQNHLTMHNEKSNPTQEHPIIEALCLHIEYRNETIATLNTMYQNRESAYKNIRISADENHNENIELLKNMKSLTIENKKLSKDNDRLNYELLVATKNLQSAEDQMSNMAKQKNEIQIQNDTVEQQNNKISIIHASQIVSSTKKSPVTSIVTEENNDPEKQTLQSPENNIQGLFSSPGQSPTNRSDNKKSDSTTKQLTFR